MVRQKGPKEYSIMRQRCVSHYLLSEIGDTTTKGICRMSPYYL